ncbi:MAG: hypothetical protein ACI37Z_10550 [Candidatus Gastranaerophilaceae bacterium]
MSLQDLYYMCLIVHTLLCIYEKYILIQKEKTLAGTKCQQTEKTDD